MGSSNSASGPFENTSVDVIDLAWGAAPLWPLVIRVNHPWSHESFASFFHGNAEAGREVVSEPKTETPTDVPPLARVVFEAAVARFVGRPLEENPFDSIDGEPQHNARTWAWTYQLLEGVGAEEAEAARGSRTPTPYERDRRYRFSAAATSPCSVGARCSATQALYSTRAVCFRAASRPRRAAGEYL